MRQLTIFAIFIFMTLCTAAQKPLRIIKATSKSVDIREDNVLRTNRWTVTPETSPDVYYTSILGKKLTFITNKDSLSLLITKSTKYDFYVLLNDSVKALTQIVYKPSYLDVLKDGGTYNRSDTRSFPKFTYQSKDNPELVSLRKGFNLDSIAGGGDEVSRILSLMHWVHNLILHDGNHDNPVVRNALSMIQQCKNDKRGLNCRGLAIVLNECYLSMGIPSRFITCMPKDSVFDDCHVVNLVYSKNLQKWLWIDPTNDAYVMDENGELLDLREVRDRLITGKPLILNPEANWNHKQTQTKDYYLLNYMAKNLFRLESPVESRYDYETWQKGKTVEYVELLPLNTFHQQPQRSENTNLTTGTTFKRYKTNNPDLFWQTPD